MKTMKFIAVSICLLGLLKGITAKNVSFETLMGKDLGAANYYRDDESKYGADSVTCVRNLSIYRGFFQNKNYADALESWRWVFNNCPLSTQNMYLDGAVMYKDMINTEKVPEKKEKLVDTLMSIYDKRIKYFGREGFVLGRKGVDLFYLNPSKMEEAYAILGKSINIEKNISKADVLAAYFQSSVKLSDSVKYGKSIVIDAYMLVSEIIDFNLKNNPKDSVYYNPTKANVEQLFAPLATCPDLINIYTKKYEATPENKELLINITTLLSKYNCIEEELFFKAAESLHKIEPTANTAYLMGKIQLSKKQYAKAAEYLQQAIKLFKEEENNKKADALLQLSEIYYLYLNQLVKAKAFALQSLELRPTDGRPLILIGDMYATSAPSCGENDIEKKVAYWAAVDKYVKAKSMDASLTNIANERIATWSKYFPKDELIFFYNFQKGEPYTVGCWINETTIIR